MTTDNETVGGDGITVPAVEDAAIPKDADKTPSKPRSKSPRSKARKAASKPSSKADKDATYIVGHDGKRVKTDDYFAPDSAEDTFIVGHDGKRVKSANYKDES